MRARGHPREMLKTRTSFKDDKESNTKHTGGEMTRAPNLQGTRTADIGSHFKQFPLTLPIQTTTSTAHRHGKGGIQGLGEILPGEISCCIR